MAARLGDADMVGTLLDAGADPNAATTNGTTPLMFAAAAGNVEALRRLLDAKADVAAKEKAMGQTALMFAAANGRTEAARILVARGADVSAASRVTNLYPFTREAEEQFRAAAGQAPAQSTAGSGGTPGPVPDASRLNDGARGVRSEAAPVPATRAPTASEPAATPAGTSGLNDGARANRAEATRATPVTGARPDATPAPTPQKPLVPGVDRNFAYNELVGFTGGLAPLHFAVRQGHVETVRALLDAGADVNRVTEGDQSSPLLIAIVNGRFDLAQELLDRGADPKLASENGVTPLYAALNVQWAPKALYPQPRAYAQQRLTHIDLMRALLDKGADPNARLKKKVWYSGYNFDLAGVDETGATPFWRAAYGADVEAMKLLKSRGADPSIWTQKPAGRPRTGDAQRDTKDVSGRPPVPVGGPAVPPLHAASGVGYGEGFAANSHRYAPSGMLAAVKFLVEDCGADVNAVDHEGNTALHHAAARGDNEMIRYLVAKGANPLVVNREGQTTVDMANSPAQRTEPFPDTIRLLEGMGAKNNNNCTSCDLGAKKAGAKDNR
jgi:ankyrin repeat protein